MRAIIWGIHWLNMIIRIWLFCVRQKWSRRYGRGSPAQKSVSSKAILSLHFAELVSLGKFLATAYIPVTPIEMYILELDHKLLAALLKFTVNLFPPSILLLDYIALSFNTEIWQTCWWIVKRLLKIGVISHNSVQLLKYASLQLPLSGARSLANNWLQYTHFCINYTHFTSNYPNLLHFMGV